MDRALVLFQSLYKYFDSDLVYELIIVVPDRHFKVLNTLKMFFFPFPIKIYKDSEILLHEKNVTDWKKPNTESQEDFKGSDGEEVSKMITSEKYDKDLIGLEYQREQYEGYAIQMVIKLIFHSMSRLRFTLHWTQMSSPLGLLHFLILFMNI